MSGGNLDLVRSIYADWERGDFSSADWADENITFVIPDGPTSGEWRGRAAMAAGWRDWLTAWAGYRIESFECHEIDDNRVLGLMRVTGIGRTSGVELSKLEGKGAAVFTVSDGKVSRLVAYTERVYPNLDRALADLGLAQ